MRVSKTGFGRLVLSCLLGVFLLSPLSLLSQEKDPYFILGSDWEDGVRQSCDRLNADWNTRKGQFEFIYVYKQSWPTFNDAVRDVLYKHFDELGSSDERIRLEHEIDDRIWETDRDSGDYKPVAVKMAWKIDHDFKVEAISLAENMESWEDFQQVRRYYHLDKNLTPSSFAALSPPSKCQCSGNICPGRRNKSINIYWSVSLLINIFAARPNSVNFPVP